VTDTKDENNRPLLGPYEELHKPCKGRFCFEIVEALGIIWWIWEIFYFSKIFSYGRTSFLFQRLRSSHLRVWSSLWTKAWAPTFRYVISVWSGFYYFLLRLYCCLTLITQVQHTIHLNNEKSAYKFGSTYVGTKQPSPTEVLFYRYEIKIKIFSSSEKTHPYLQAFPVMIGEMSNEGNLQAQLIHQLTDQCRLKCIAQVIYGFVCVRALCFLC